VQRLFISNKFTIYINHYFKKTSTMTYPIIPIGLIAVFIVCVLYLLLIKKDRKKTKIVLFPGLIFIGVWAVIYYCLLK